MLVHWSVRNFDEDNFGGSRGRRSSHSRSLRDGGYGDDDEDPVTQQLLLPLSYCGL